MELWLHTFADAGRVAPRARQAEAWGFHGLQVADSQCLNADVWVELALAAAATERLRVGTGVTNPVTRHVTVTASAAATLQAESGGRVVVGVGRGDTAVGRIGRAPVSPAELQRFLSRLGALVRGEAVDGWSVAVAAGVPPPPIEVAATGPRTIQAAVRHAQRITFTVGAEPNRLRWAIEHARDAARRAGRNPDAIQLGAYLNVAVDPDPAAAADLVRGNTAMLASFSPDRTQDPDDAFVQRFALVGPAEHVTERLRALAGLGLGHVVVVPGSLGADSARLGAADERFARAVVPYL